MNGKRPMLKIDNFCENAQSEIADWAKVRELGVIADETSVAFRSNPICSHVRQRGRSSCAVNRHEVAPRLSGLGQGGQTDNVVFLRRIQHLCRLEGRST